jgi:predicted nucleic acid-binding protein
MFAVDTNVVLDVVAGPEPAARRSAALLQESLRQGALVACGPVWAELAALRDADSTDRILANLRIEVDWHVGKNVMLHTVGAWQRYLGDRRRGEPVFICPHCRKTAGEWQCPNCAGKLPPPRHILPDFLIGGHAEARGLPLITRDVSIYRRYFPELTLLQP